MKLRGEIIHPELWAERSFAVTWDGKPKVTIGIGGIVYNVRVGDNIFGWVSDQLNAGVAVSDSDASRQAAINVYSCIGNSVKMLTGDCKGVKGTVVGKTHNQMARNNRIIVDFQPDDLKKLTIGDRMEIEAWGSGLAIDEYNDLRIMSLSPQLVEAMKLKENGKKIQVPVTNVLPGNLMGVGVGSGASEAGSWNIQSCSPKLNKKYGLESLRFGDIVAVKNVSSDYGNSVYQGGLIVGVISHGASDLGGHGPGLAIIFSTKKNRIEPVIEDKANVAYYLGLRKDKKW